MFFGAALRSGIPSEMRDKAGAVQLHDCDSTIIQLRAGACEEAQESDA
jgi:hypothetical protein